MITTILLILSLTINVFAVFYIKWLLKNINFFSENIITFLESIQAFSTHLEGVHALETYYGEQTLKNLISHSKDIIEEIRRYREIYTLTQDEEEIGDIFDEGLAEDSEEEEEE